MGCVYNCDAAADLLAFAAAGSDTGSGSSNTALLQPPLPTGNALVVNFPAASSIRAVVAPQFEYLCSPVTIARALGLMLPLAFGCSCFLYDSS
jgi:hypothetical protein